MPSVRNAAVAGLFYPGEAQSLSAELEELLGGVEQNGPRLGFPKALIVPHAGYIYSGPVAARAYDELAPARGVVRRVVLLGPVHRVPVRGLAVPTDAAFATPLGTVPIDHDALSRLTGLQQVVPSDAAHLHEHALEVQLPFLQRQLGEFSLVPFAVGEATPEQVAEVIGRLWGGRETLIVISTDLSHYHPYGKARQIDRNTVTRIARFATDLDHEEACGATPLNGFLLTAQQRSLGIKLLAACNSGDTAGGKGQVVGYSAFALYEPGAEVDADQAGKTLLGIARAAIESRLFGNAYTADAPWLRQAGATFVTLTRDGELRGCIGSLEAARPLGSDVAENALAAAFRDPRFAPMTADEWPRIRVEVSFLSAPKPMRFADEADLIAQIRPGEDGLILEADGRRATFLPQVWESIPDTRDFLQELLRKAGLPADRRIGRCKVFRYRVTKWAE
ncbi:MAG TPA: AmmeMemoRadiSam system protein B [Burkholderiales bacterium]|nr:AmmeMemoRadiSam system protein B [Burkholderiales bacterium]